MNKKLKIEKSLKRDCDVINPDDVMPNESFRFLPPSQSSSFFDDVIVRKLLAVRWFPT